MAVPRSIEVVTVLATAHARNGGRCVSVNHSPENPSSSTRRAIAAVSSSLTLAAYASSSTSVRLEAEGAGDGVALDLAGASRDGGDDRLPIAVAHHALAREAVPGQDLHSPTRGLDVGLGSLELRHRRLPMARR